MLTLRQSPGVLSTQLYCVRMELPKQYQAIVGHQQEVQKSYPDTVYLDTASQSTG